MVQPAREGLEELADPETYLRRLADALHDKSRVVRYLPRDAASVLDVGCSDGRLTTAMALSLPETRFRGIDLNEAFITRAGERARTIGNVVFERVYLRDLLARPERFDAVTFCSVLHEFYTYGEGISSVLKALADAHELLRPGGLVIIRDMILSDYTKAASLHCATIVEKIQQRPYTSALADFVRRFGPVDTIYNVNHFLLKYLYTDNWKHELGEHYVAVTFEQYDQIFKLLGMRLQFRSGYLLDFLRQKWREDFELDDDELASLSSTGLLVAQK